MLIVKLCFVVPNEYELVNVFEVIYILGVLKKYKTVMHTLIFMSHAFRVISILMDSPHAEFLLLLTEKYTSNLELILISLYKLPGYYGGKRDMESNNKILYIKKQIFIWKVMIELKGKKRSLETIGKYLLMFSTKINYKMNVEWVSLLNRNIMKILFKNRYMSVTYAVEIHNDISRYSHL